MRSVEAARRVAAPMALAAAAALSACAAGPTPHAAATAPSSVSATVTPPSTPPPVDPAVQSRFDGALVALRQNRLDLAEQGLRALALEHPELGGVQTNLGLLLLKKGRVDEAVQTLKIATRQTPVRAAAFDLLGVALRQSGDFDGARGAYERALAIDADHAPALLNLGILEDLYLGHPARAAELYARYLALTPEGDATVTKWLAEVKGRKGAQLASNREDSK